MVNIFDMELYTETMYINLFKTQKFFIVNVTFMTYKVIILSECYKLGKG